MEKNEQNTKAVSTVEEKLKTLIYDFLSDMSSLVDDTDELYFKNTVLNAFPIRNRKTRKMGMQILLKSFRKDLSVYFDFSRNAEIEAYFRAHNQSLGFPRFTLPIPPPPKKVEKRDFIDTDLVDRVLDVMIKALRDARKNSSNDLDEKL